jgi:DUF971 family protein
MPDTPRPTSLRREGDGLRIDWADGASTLTAWRTLRANCPCATCNDERQKPADPFKVLKPQEVAAGPPAPAGMRPVGLYAYQITWNDGHDAGIYTLDTLRNLGVQS